MYLGKLTMAHGLLFSFFFKYSAATQWTNTMTAEKKNQ